MCVSVSVCSRLSIWAADAMFVVLFVVRTYIVFMIPFVVLYPSFHHLCCCCVSIRAAQYSSLEYLALFFVLCLLIYSFLCSYPFLPISLSLPKFCSIFTCFFNSIVDCGWLVSSDSNDGKNEWINEWMNEWVNVFELVGSWLNGVCTQYIA